MSDTSTPLDVTGRSDTSHSKIKKECRVRTKDKDLHTYLQQSNSELKVQTELTLWIQRNKKHGYPLIWDKKGPK